MGSSVVGYIRQSIAENMRSSGLLQSHDQVGNQYNLMQSMRSSEMFRNDRLPSMIKNNLLNSTKDNTFVPVDQIVESLKMYNDTGESALNE